MGNMHFVRETLADNQWVMVPYNYASLVTLGCTQNCPMAEMTNCEEAPVQASAWEQSQENLVEVSLLFGILK